MEGNCAMSDDGIQIVDNMVAVNLIDMWTSFLPIANLLFAVVFVIVIYSTATGQGLTNYSVKKILPRLIAVAIAVNVSFYLCAIVADLVNIVAVGIPDLIFGTEWRQAMQGMADINTAQTIMGGFIGVIVLFMAGMITVVAVLVTVLALAARQILLSMLVIISPLAVVCAVLPATQKWFEKWAKTYVQLLAVYPMFMLVWAGSRWFQFNIESLTGTGGVVNVALSFMVQVIAPIIPAVAIYPLLKMSGGVMGKIAGQIDKSPLGTQGALGKMAQDRDATRRKLTSSRVQAAGAGLGDIKTKYSKLGDAEKETIEKARSDPGTAAWYRPDGRLAPRPAGLSAEQASQWEDLKKLDDRSSASRRSGAFVARNLSRMGSAALNLPYGGRNRKAAVDQMSQMAQNESYANWMNDTNRARRYGGGVVGGITGGVAGKNGRYSTALQGQAITTKAELDKKSVQGASAIISDAIKTAIKNGASQDAAMNSAIGTYNKDKFQIQGLTQALLAEGSSGIGKFARLLSVTQGSLRDDLNQEILANKSAIESKDIIAVSAAQNNVSYAQAAQMDSTYDVSIDTAITQNKKIIRIMKGETENIDLGGATPTPINAGPAAGRARSTFDETRAAGAANPQIKAKAKAETYDARYWDI